VDDQVYLGMNGEGNADMAFACLRMPLVRGVESRDGGWEEERCVGHIVAGEWVEKRRQPAERGADVEDPEPLLAAFHGVSMGRNQAGRVLCRLISIQSPPNQAPS